MNEGRENAVRVTAFDKLWQHVTRKILACSFFAPLAAS